MSEYIVWVWSQAAHGWRQGRAAFDKFDAMDRVRKLLDEGRRAKVTFHGEQIFPAVRTGLRRGGKRRKARGSGGAAGLIAAAKALKAVCGGKL